LAIFGNDKSADAGETTSNRKEPLRFRLYFPLMDISSAVYVLAVAMAIYMMVTQTDPETLPWVLNIGIAVFVLIVTVIILPVLIVLPWIRDEYAELLWARTVKQLTVLVVLLPPLSFGLLWLLYFILSGGVPDPSRPDWLDTIYAEHMWFDTVFGLWRYYTLAFVILFQFNRWRDSRASSE
jgi:hypothetical protein